MTPTAASPSPGSTTGCGSSARTERAAIAALPFDEAAYLAQVGAPSPFGEAGYTTLERLWARPTLEVNGMWGGYQGPGQKTVIPSEAHAKITCRLVPDQDPDSVIGLVRRHLEITCHQARGSPSMLARMGLVRPPSRPITSRSSGRRGASRSLWGAAIDRTHGRHGPGRRALRATHGTANGLFLVLDG